MNTNNGISLSTLFVVVMISIGALAFSAVQGVESTRNLSKVNTFKNEAFVSLGAVQDMYLENSLSHSDDNLFTTSDSGDYQGFCVTLEGLINNLYLDKDISDYGGVFLAEVPFDGGATKYTAWYHNGNMAINGIEKNNINSLKKDESYNKDDDKISGGKLVVTTNLNGVKKIIEQAKNEAPITIKSEKSRGGTGEVYTGIKCITNNLLEE